MEFVQKILQRELADKQSRNSSYSLRAFARDLGLGPASLSDFLNSKRQLSKTSLAKVATKLSLTPKEKEKFLQTKITRSKSNTDSDRRQLVEDEFRVISNWYYLAILSLADFKNNKADPKWITERLKITLAEATTALNRLKRLGLIKITRGKMVTTSKPLSTTRDIPSTAIRKHHAETLKLAETSLFNDDVHLREFSSITMSIDVNKLPEAKNLLMKTKRKISQMLDSKTPTAVYNLSFQLFPLTKTTTKG